MRFALASVILLCLSSATFADVVTLGGDSIGPDSTTTDGQGAVSGQRIGPEERYRGQPGLAFSLGGLERLKTLRAIVTFTSRETGKIHVPNHRFRARLWTLCDYLGGNAHLHEVELGMPLDVEFTTRPDGSVVPARTFGEARGRIPAGVPSYDFRWDLSSHSAFADPLPAGHYVLALYSLADAEADGEFHVGMTQGPLGLPAVFFADGCCPFGPDYIYPCLFPNPCLSWAMTLQVEMPCEECEECQEDREEPRIPGGGGVVASSLTGQSRGFGDFLTGIGGLSGLGGGVPSLGGGFPPSLGGPSNGPLFGSGTSSSPPSSLIPFLPKGPVFGGDTSTDFPDFEPPETPPPPQTTPVPEPGSVVLIVLGLLMFWALRGFKSCWR